MYMTRYGKTEHTASLIRAVRSVQATYAAVSVVFHNKEKILNSPIWYVPKNPTPCRPRTPSVLHLLAKNTGKDEKQKKRCRRWRNRQTWEQCLALRLDVLCLRCLWSEQVASKSCDHWNDEQENMKWGECDHERDDMPLFCWYHSSRPRLCGDTLRASRDNDIASCSVSVEQ